jgi:signal transduction histidine kinase
MLFPFARLRGEYAQSAELAFLRHELAQPLTYLSASLALLERRLGAALSTDPASARALGAAEEALNHVVELVRAIGSEDSAETWAPTDLGELARSVALMVEDELRERADLVVDVTDGVLVNANWTRLTQVLLNLLTNAALAVGESGRRRGNIVIRVILRAEGSAILVIQDDGIGISSGIESRLGELHFTTRPGRGSGFGLALCRAIVESHGGALTITGARGGGTIATVTLPALRAEKTSPRDVSSECSR